ncbi:MAG: patatin-like phospholipase family protein [Acidobacteria bacterium]|nr:patatin-like phospholipase family protein [Acidobacteriota bacterium]
MQNPSSDNHFVDLNTSTEKDCDLVMEGGIASGIVYPSAILELSKTYRFFSIAGTSAGAIAATATAVAEFGRQQKLGSNLEKNIDEKKVGFNGLKELNDEICKEGFLINLFQASENTKPLMDLAKKTILKVENKISKNKSSGILENVKTYFINKSLLILFLIAIAFGLFGAIVDRYFFAGIGNWLYLILIAMVITTLILINQLASLKVIADIFINHLPNEKYGMCTGHSKKHKEDQQPPLTDWFYQRLQKMSGKPENVPLTFCDLKKHKIILRMMTTNLSQNQPFKLPFEREEFIFKEREMKEFFNEDVVKYLKNGGTTTKNFNLPEGYFFMPSEYMPVIVAMRLSLSFPILLCAIPLYTISMKAISLAKEVETDKSKKFNLEEKDLQKNWFSDGGVCRNFPIHFFDDWLPTRPTFGINLTSMPDDYKKAIDEDNKMEEDNFVSTKTMRDDLETSSSILSAISRVKPNDEMAVEFTDIKDLIGFFEAMISTLNYSDNMQSILPGYRERIAYIRLNSSEGGLNLMMPKKTITKMKEKGKEAGTKLLTFELEHHQWVRFLTLAGQLEEHLANKEDILKCYKELLDKVNKDFPYYNDKDKDWARGILEKLQICSKIFAGEKLSNKEKNYIDNIQKQSASSNLPKPKPLLIMSPDFGTYDDKNY